MNALSKIGSLAASSLALLAMLSGCATSRVVVIDRNSDWVKLGPDVVGHVYTWDAATKGWVLQKKKMRLPESWVAGPAPED
jgi:1,2-phenylacetyl-CoA epoxidase catalytic subunit